jgi:hypothetical protein
VIPIKNFIVSQHSSVRGFQFEFYLRSSLFHFSLGDSESYPLVFWCSKQWNILQNHAKPGSYVANFGRKMAILEQGELEETPDHIIVDKDGRSVFENYLYATKNGREVLIDRMGGHEIVISESYGRILCERNNYLYFQKQGKTIMKVDSDFHEIQSISYEGQGFSGVGISCADRFIFIVLKGPVLILEIIDSENLQAVARFEGVSTSLDLSSYGVNGLYYIFCGDDVFLWDEVSLQRVDLPGKVSCHLVKDDCFYLAFFNDPHIYAFDFTQFQPITRKKVTSDNFFPVRLAGRSGMTTAIMSGARKLPGGMEKLAIWNDVDFFREELNPEFEEPVCSTHEIEVEDMFSLEISVDASASYSVLARQVPAFLSEALYVHGESVIHPEKPYSDRFSGNVKVIFNMSELLLDEYKQELAEACKETEEFFRFSHGHATGKVCTVDVEFAV